MLTLHEYNWKTAEIPINKQSDTLLSEPVNMSLKELQRQWRRGKSGMLQTTSGLKELDMTYRLNKTHQYKMQKKYYLTENK